MEVSSYIFGANSLVRVRTLLDRGRSFVNAPSVAGARLIECTILAFEEI